MTTKEAAEAAGLVESTGRKYAKILGISSIGKGNRKEYQWTEADVERLREATKETKPRVPSEDEKALLLAVETAVGMAASVLTKNQMLGGWNVAEVLKASGYTVDDIPAMERLADLPDLNETIKWFLTPPIRRNFFSGNHKNEVDKEDNEAVAIIDHAVLQSGRVSRGDTARIECVLELALKKDYGINESHLPLLKNIASGKYDFGIHDHSDLGDYSGIAKRIIEKLEGQNG